MLLQETIFVLLYIEIKHYELSFLGSRQCYENINFLLLCLVLKTPQTVSMSCSKLEISLCQ